MDVLGKDRFHPGALGHLEDVLQPVRGGLVRADDAEVLRGFVQLHHGTQEVAHRLCRFGLHRAGLPGGDGVVVQAQGDRGICATDHHWHADWRSCAARLAVPSRGLRRSERLRRRTALRAGSSSAIPPAASDARDFRRSPTAEPDATARSPRSSARRPPSVRSSPLGCAARSSAISDARTVPEPSRAAFWMARILSIAWSSTIAIRSCISAGSCPSTKSGS